MSKPLDDQLYGKPLKKIADFAFDDNVAEVFADMIERSVPGYSAIIPLIGMLAEHYIQKNSRCYDLGCSLGAVSFAITRFLQQSDKNIDGCEIVAVDNAGAMLERCQAHIDVLQSTVPIHLQCEDINNVVIEKASVVVLNFTLQFISLDKRQALLEKIYKGLLPGGVLIISEKILAHDATQQNLLSDLHHVFKKANGYSDLEVSQKRTALENVLVPESLDAHHQRLNDIGFLDVVTWFQCFNFASILAVK